MISIRTKKFENQLKAFLFEVKDISPEQRNKMLNKVEKKNDQIGATIIDLLDQNASVRKSQILGSFMSHLISGVMDVETFHRLSYIVQNIYEKDVDNLINQNEGKVICQHAKDALLSFGLLELHMHKFPSILGIGGIQNRIIKNYKISSLGSEFLRYLPL